VSSVALKNTGSFRDPSGKIYEVDTTHRENTTRRILRGVDQATLELQKTLFESPFYQSLVESGKIVSTQIIAPDSDCVYAQQVLGDGWAGVLEHRAIPFISYPYEWSFNMLQDAAILQLEILEEALEHDWILKDATPYNIQWLGSKPVFIDTPSFVPWTPGSPWTAYRQFCSMYFTPLAIHAYLGIDHCGLLRSNLNGLDPVDSERYFSGLKKLKKGVLSHIVLPAGVEKRILKNERDNAPAVKRLPASHSRAMVIGLVQSMSRLISNMKLSTVKTDWSDYDATHSYAEHEHQDKKDFIEKAVTGGAYNLAWDIGCNTGTFSKICAQHCNYVVAADGDQLAIDKLYKDQQASSENTILPMVLNLANVSPGQGWAGNERTAFDRRTKPDLVICLALIHHLRLTENIPNALFLEWLRSLQADIIIEFVNREDEMVRKLLTNKEEQYIDYNETQFMKEMQLHFEIKDRSKLKGGKRELFLLRPKRADE